MKNSAKLLLPLILLIFIASCSMFRTQQTGTLFTFEYEGKTYEITGYTNEVGESANYLTHRDQNNVVFRAVDHSRSGIIDQIVSGSVTVMEANEIYQFGIQIAMEQDLFKNIDRNRTFESEYGDYRMMVETYQKQKGKFHNRFLLYDLNWELIGVFWDDDSDGTIDRSEAGNMEMESAQNLYTIALERAEESERLIETDESRIIISKNQKRYNKIAGVSHYRGG